MVGCFELECDWPIGLCKMSHEVTPPKHQTSFVRPDPVRHLNRHVAREDSRDTRVHTGVPPIAGVGQHHLQVLPAGFRIFAARSSS